MVENRCSVQREGVYRWFSVLSSAQRAEFLCGLLDLCVPIELRFLGSCLEDLARKDYYSLRDAEIKANNPADLSNLTNITDEVVRSKLLVSLALLGSENREAAAVLFRTLTHIDAIINNYYGLQLNDGQKTEEQFLLLFTMASNHPAFSFHQKQVLRQELSQLQEILLATCGGGEAQGGGVGGGGGGGGGRGGMVGLACLSPPLASCTPLPAAYIPASTSCQAQCPCCHKSQQHREVLAGPGPRLGAGPGVGRGDQGGAAPDPVPPHPSTSCQEAPCKMGKHGKVSAERIDLKGVTYKADKTREYMLEVSWCDASVSTVVRGHQELLDLLTQVSKVFPDEGLDKLLPQSPDYDPALELDRRLTSLPPHVLRHHHVTLFFSPASPAPPVPPPGPPTPLAPSGSFPHTANLGCLLPYRGSSRTVCGVASIQPVMSIHTSIQPRSPPQLAHLSPQLPPHLPPQVPMPVPPPGGVATACGETGPPPPTGHLHNLPPQPTSPEQNGILDWLRKLRLHKYYPVFKQLTMEEFLALTEDDLNKYDLTQGAKKKLKTQLELQKEKMEKRYVVSQFPVSCGGIARVTPSSHMVSVAHLHSTAHAELRVEVDTGISPAFHRDGSSSSGYSSAPCSPMAPLCRDAAFDSRAKDAHRRMESCLDPSGGDKDRPSCVPPLNPIGPAGPSRPTAQVLPVQNDPTPCPAHLSLLPPPSLPLLSPAPGRLLGSSPRKPRPPPLCAEDRAKPLGCGGPGSGVGVRLESLFTCLNLDSPPPPLPPPPHPPPPLPSHHLQEPKGPRGPPVSGALRSPPGLSVETTSTALASTSNHTLHHVSTHPPLPPQVSPSLPPRSPGHYPPYPSSSSASSLSSCFPSSASCVSMAGGGGGGGGVPMATVVPGNTYCATNSVAPPTSSSPASSSSAVADGGGYALAAPGGPSLAAASSSPAGASSPASVCVCSSCGCRGNCGSYGALPGGYAGYFQHPFSGTSVFTLGPLLHLSPLLAAGGTAGAFSYPLVAPPLYNNSTVSHDPQSPQQQQQGLVLPPMQGFLGSGSNIYQPHGMLGNGGYKRVGNLSCYNCGGSGHRAGECKQPPMDSLQQGMFRLKYSPHSDSKDSGD